MNVPSTNIWLGIQSALLQGFIGIHPMKLRDWCFGVELFLLMPTLTISFGAFAISIGRFPFVLRT